MQRDALFARVSGKKLETTKEACEVTAASVLALFSKAASAGAGCAVTLESCYVTKAGDHCVVATFAPPDGAIRVLHTLTGSFILPLASSGAAVVLDVAKVQRLRTPAAPAVLPVISANKVRCTLVMWLCPAVSTGWSLLVVCLFVCLFVCAVGGAAVPQSSATSAHCRAVRAAVTPRCR